MIGSFRRHHPKIHPSVFVAPTATVIGQVEIGAGSSIWFGAVLRGDIKGIRIGRRTNIQDNAVVHVEEDRDCAIGNGVIVGHQATIHAARVGDGALVGIGARVLNGCVVGKGAVIASGAVVLEGTRIPPYSLAVGLPARVVRKLTRREIAKHRRSVASYARLGAWFASHPAFAFDWDRATAPIDDLRGIF